jgi:hypothetical protein
MSVHYPIHAGLSECDHSSKDGRAAWRLIHRSPYNSEITLGGYIEFVWSIVTNITCERCRAHTAEIFAELNKFKEQYQEPGELAMKLADNQCMLNDACMLAFRLHNSVTSRIEKDSATGAMPKKKGVSWNNLPSDSDVISMLRAQWGQRGECSAR